MIYDEKRTITITTECPSCHEKSDVDVHLGIDLNHATVDKVDLL